MSAPNPTCIPFLEDARAYMDGELPPDARRLFEAHVEACRGCRDALAGLVAVAHRLDEALGLPASSVRDRVLGAILAGGARAVSSPVPRGSGTSSVSVPVARGETMSRLQPCPKCGAQFDVSTFAPGTKFTCGSCGGLVTAGVPAASPQPSRVPPPPSRAVPAPSAARAAGSPSAPPRGPQYRPLERHQDPRAIEAPPPRSTSDRGRDREERGGRGDREERGRGAPRKKALSPAALAGISLAGLGLVVGLAWLALGGNKDKGPTDADQGTAAAGAMGGMNASGPGAAGTTGSSAGMGGAAAAEPGMASAPTGSSPSDVLAAIQSDYKTLGGSASKAQMRDAMMRAKALGTAPALDFAKQVAKDLLALADPKDPDAHEILGHKHFTQKVPDTIDFRKYPFIRAVEEASEREWFDDDEAYALAMKAWEKTEAHGKRLNPDDPAYDPTYKALETARKDIDRDPYFKGYNYDAIFASPYLICYSSDERIDPEDFIKLSKAERRKKMEELDKKKEKYQRILAEKAKIFTQLYAEFRKRYGEACDLRDLMAPFGGREDYPPSKRSFREGCPLIVWIFSDKNAFRDYHEKVKREGINEGVAGYFSPATGWVYLYDEEAGDREFEINKNVHEGTHQLQHWFTRQKNEWGPAYVPQSFFGEGFAEYTGSVTMDKDRTITFVGVNRPRLHQLASFKEDIKKHFNKDNLPIFPLKEFVGFEGYNTVTQWALEHWGPIGGAGLGIFYIQAWGFVYFLNEFQNGKYRPAFVKFVNDMLNVPKASEGYTFEKFKKEFGLVNDSKWKALQGEFDPFYKNLLTMDLTKVGPMPPARDDWPGYVPPESLDANPANAAKKDAGGK